VSWWVIQDSNLKPTIKRRRQEWVTGEGFGAVAMLGRQVGRHVVARTDTTGRRGCMGVGGGDRHGPVHAFRRFMDDFALLAEPVSDAPLIRWAMETFATTVRL
jgi:hypothetical protein